MTKNKALYISYRR